MDKQQLLSFIEEQINQGKITKDDLAQITKESRSETEHNSPTPTKEESSKKIIITFYVIGAIIAIAGVTILVGQHWNEIGFIGRVLVSLGISLVAYISAMILNKPHQRIASQVLFMISAVLAPLGAYVLLDHANIDITLSVQVATSLVLSIIFATALFVSKKNVLTLITVGFATWLYYATLMYMFNFSYYNADFLKWASMLLGASYILIAYGYGSITKALEKNDLREKRAVANMLYGVGTLAILAAGISVGGIFDLVFIAFIFAAFYGSVYLKSRGMLNLAALFLIMHIIKLTSKYFVGSIGWSLALIVVGFLMIGVGYMTYGLNRKLTSLKNAPQIK